MCGFIAEQTMIPTRIICQDGDRMMRRDHVIAQKVSICISFICTRYSTFIFDAAFQSINFHYYLFD